MPCRVHFPFRVQRVHHWWTVARRRGVIRRVDPPKQWTGRPTNRLDAEKPGGFYIPSEVKEWSMLQSMPIYFSQLENNLQMKSCAALGCPMPVREGGYDWSKLQRPRYL